MTHTPDCTCIVHVSWPIDIEPDEIPPMSYSVIHCQMHKATLELLAAAKLIREFVPANTPGCDCERCDADRQLDAAIAKVEGGVSDG